MQFRRCLATKAPSPKRPPVKKTDTVPLASSNAAEVSIQTRQLLRPVDATRKWPMLSAADLRINAVYELPVNKGGEEFGGEWPARLLLDDNCRNRRLHSAPPSRERRSVTVLWTEQLQTLWETMSRENMLVDGIAGTGKSLALMCMAHLWRQKAGPEGEPRPLAWVVPNVQRWLTGHWPYEPYRGEEAIQQRELALHLIKSFLAQNTQPTKEPHPILATMADKLRQWTTGETQFDVDCLQRDVLEQLPPTTLIALDGVNGIVEPTVRTQYCVDLTPASDAPNTQPVLEHILNDRLHLVQAFRRYIAEAGKKNARILGVTHRSDPLFPMQAVGSVKYGRQWRPLTMAEAKVYIKDVAEAADPRAAAELPTSKLLFLSGGRMRHLQEALQYQRLYL